MLEPEKHMRWKKAKVSQATPEELRRVPVLAGNNAAAATASLCPGSLVGKSSSAL